MQIHRILMAASENRWQDGMLMTAEKHSLVPAQPVTGHCLVVALLSHPAAARRCAKEPRLRAHAQGCRGTRVALNPKP